MKTSNKIIITSCAFSLIGILTFYISGKKHQSNFTKTLVELNNFSVIVAEENSVFNITTGMDNKIAVSHLKDKELVKDFFKVKNDTLFMYNTNNINQTDIKVIAKNISFIKAKQNSTLYINEICTDSLYLFAEKSIIKINANYLENKKNNITYFEIKAINTCYIDVFRADINHIEVSLNNSSVYFNEINTKNFNSDLKNHSYMHLKDVISGKFQADTDNTSSYEVDK